MWHTYSIFMRSGPADTHTKMVKRIKRSISETDIIRTCFWRRKLASYCVRIEKEAFRERLVQINLEENRRSKSIGKCQHNAELLMRFLPTRKPRFLQNTLVRISNEVQSHCDWLFLENLRLRVNGAQQLPTLLRQQCWELLRACWQWCANGCNNSQ